MGFPSCVSAAAILFGIALIIEVKAIRRDADDIEGLTTISAKSFEDDDYTNSASDADIGLTGQAVQSSLAFVSRGLTIIPMRNFEDFEYTIDAGFDGLPQRFALQVDTGSSLLVLASNSGFDLEGEEVEISYSSGGGKGVKSEADVSIGKLTIDGVPFVKLTNQAGNLFGKFPIDGIFGLGPPWSAPKYGFPNLLQVLVDSKEIEHYVCSFYFTSGGKDGSQLILGGVDESLYSGTLSYVASGRLEGYEAGWLVAPQDMKANNVSTGSCAPPQTCETLIDTGASVCMLPVPFYEAMGRRDFGEVDCSIVGSLPVITITMCERDFDFGPDFYVRRFREGSQEKCELGVTYTYKHPGVPYILGLPFLRKFYTVYDGEQKRLGFADAKL